MASWSYRADRDCWIARIYDPTRPSRERSKTFGKGASKREAARLAPAVIAELQAAANDAAAHRGTVREYVNTWMTRRGPGLSPTTVNGYKAIIRRINKRFGRMQLAAVQPQDVETWYYELHAQGLTPATVERHHQVMRAIFRKAVKDRLIAHVPTDVDRPKGPPRRLRIPDDATVLRAMDDLDGDFGNFFRLLVLTGMRRGELMGLVWGDLESGPELDGEATLVINVRRNLYDLKGQRGVYGPTKSKQERQVLVDGEAIAVFDAQRLLVEQHTSQPVAPGRPVFPDLTADATGATAHRPGWATEWWRRNRTHLGMAGVRLHDLRHHHATRLLSRGVPVMDVSARLGHSKTSTTLDIYGKSTLEGQLRATSAARMRPALTKGE